MPTEERAKLGKAIEFAFQDIAVRITLNQSAIGDEVATRVNTIQLFISAKKIIGKAFDVPLPDDLAGFNAF